MISPRSSTRSPPKRTHPTRERHVPNARPLAACLLCGGPELRDGRVGPGSLGAPRASTPDRMSCQCGSGSGRRVLATVAGWYERALELRHHVASHELIAVQHLLACGPLGGLDEQPTVAATGLVQAFDRSHEIIGSAHAPGATLHHRVNDLVRRGHQSPGSWPRVCSKYSRW